MTNAEKILSLLTSHPGLDDDEISRRTGVSPRQQVNIVCRRLAGQGLLVRRPGPSGKIGNFPRSGRWAQEKTVSAEARVTRQAVAVRSEVPVSLSLEQLRQTLILIPCSGSKSSGGTSARGCAPLTDDLPQSLAERLVSARGAVLSKAEFDDRELMPALQRYQGMLYSSAGQALQGGVDAGLHVLIISGGYGAIKAAEPIGYYSTRLVLSAWPRGLLEEVLLSYVRRHKLTRVRAFVSTTTDYCRLVARVRWQDGGVKDATIVAPETSRGAMVKAPRAQGESLAAFLAGELKDGWRSSDGLRVVSTRI